MKIFPMNTPQTPQESAKEPWENHNRCNTYGQSIRNLRDKNIALMSHKYRVGFAMLRCIPNFPYHLNKK